MHSIIIQAIISPFTLKKGSKNLSFSEDDEALLVDEALDDGDDDDSSDADDNEDSEDDDIPDEDGDEDDDLRAAREAADEDEIASTIAKLQADNKLTSEEERVSRAAVTKVCCCLCVCATSLTFRLDYNACKADVSFSISSHRLQDML